MTIMLDLEIRNCTVVADNGAIILSIPDLTIAPGERVGIRGPSGAGKSTLLYLLAGLQPSVIGSVRWGDIDLAQAGEDGCTKFRRDHVGMIFQDFHLFEELGALDNAALTAAFSPRKDRSSILSQAKAGLERLGIKTAKRRVESFSGGERQRVSVARALAKKPSILLADEPTASLDREAADRLVEDLVTLTAAQGTTLITVSHDPHLLNRMDRVVDIVDGAMPGAEAKIHAA